MIKINGRVYYSVVLIFAFIMVMGFASAEQIVLGDGFKQNQCVILKQSCSNCTFVNITSVTTKDSNGAGITLLTNKEMSKEGTDYSYSFCNTTYISEYTYNTLGDLDGVLTVQPVTFNVTPSGYSAPLGLFILVIGVIYAIGFIGFFAKNEWVSILGGMAMMGLGLFTINNGIDVFRNQITEIFSWTTIAIGALFALVAGVELIQENI